MLIWARQAGRSRWPALVAVHYRAGRRAPAVQYWTDDRPGM